MYSMLDFKAFTLTVVIITSLTSVDTRLCPEYCDCDIYEGRNRADCSRERLINADVDLSNSVEILDLSYNSIAVIDNSCFQSYQFLINLTVTHNDIHTIYLDAFVNLRRLRSLDLAYNRLEYLDERLFESNRNLEFLNLEGNKFVALPNRAFLRSTSLRILNLRDCGIDHIPAELLTALPQLIELNLSQNLMITLSAAPFNAPKCLKLLLLHENAWNCDKVLVKALSIMRHRGMNVSITECDDAYSEWQRQLPLRGQQLQQQQEQQQSRMFERMQLPLSTMSPATTNETNNTTAKPRTVLNWRNLSGENEDSDDSDNDMVDFANYIDNNKRSPPRLGSHSRLNELDITVDEQVCEGSPENLCRRYRNCLEKVSHFVISQMYANDAKNLIYTQNDLNFAFLLGATVGMIGFIVVIICALSVKYCHEYKKEEKHNDLEAVYSSITPMQHNPLSSTDEENYIHQSRMEAPTARSIPPPPIRRPRRNRRPQTRDHPIDHALVPRPPGSDNFISRLLGRPARHRYYRVGTTTLIRCLSRTSLFNNSNNLQREPNSGTPITENAQTNVTAAAAASSSTIDRPETPPPNYGDIVHKN